MTTTAMGYDVDDRGIIVSPGKFEGEPLFVVAFWDLGLEGICDEDITDENDDPVWVFYLSDKDYAEWPALQGWARLSLWEDSNGFVHHSLSGKTE